MKNEKGEKGKWKAIALLVALCRELLS
jgi:hypothetical protein